MFNPTICEPPVVLTIAHPLTLGQKVRLLRVARDWRQFDLCYHSAVTPYALSLIERDLDYPVEALRRIADTLGVELEVANG